MQLPNHVFQFLPHTNPIFFTTKSLYASAMVGKRNKRINSHLGKKKIHRRNFPSLVPKCKYPVDKTWVRSQLHERRKTKSPSPRLTLLFPVSSLHPRRPQTGTPGMFYSTHLTICRHKFYETRGDMAVHGVLLGLNSTNRHNTTS